jgi:KaiC/GvpD/RAD55 family RecA-like ATPase
MLFLHQSVLLPQRTAASLPGMFPSLLERGISLRHGELALAAGAPGSGKSSLALALAVRCGQPTLYFSADTTKENVTIRLLSMLTGMDQRAAEEAKKNDPLWASQVLQAASHIAIDPNSSPTLEHIENSINAFREFGTDPSLIVIDNAQDVAFDTGDTWQALHTLMRELRWWARSTNAATLVLHHTRQENWNGQAPPLYALQGKISAVPAMVLTLSAENPGFLGVCAAKNRYGAASPTGTEVNWLAYDPATMTISDLGGES